MGLSSNCGLFTDTFCCGLKRLSLRVKGGIMFRWLASICCLQFLAEFWNKLFVVGLALCGRGDPKKGMRIRKKGRHSVYNYMFRHLRIIWNILYKFNCLGIR